MPIPAAHRDRSAYHFTLLDNLPGIIQGGLLSPNEQARRSVNHRSIAEAGIQARRARMRVTCGPGGVVHDYVPFYYTSLSPMLQAVINAKNVDQFDIIHLAVPISLIERPDVVFSDAAANTEIPPRFYADPEDLTNLRWETIDPQTWRWQGADKQARMAEMLVHSAIRLEEISHIIVWNQRMKQQVEQIFAEARVAPPLIEFTGHQRKFHYFTTFWDRANNVSIVTGPKGIKTDYLRTIHDVRQIGQNPHARFRNLEALRSELRQNFASLPETAGIDGLESDNAIHHEDVGAHTRTVRDNVVRSPWYARMNPADQRLVEIAAYLHDIGKGPKARWAHNDGRQKNDPDHPIGSVKMLRRILTEELATIKPRSIRVLAKLVCYHDLVGDIVGRGRDEAQLMDIAESERELDMLITLGMADMAALGFGGFEHILPLRERVLAALAPPVAEDED